MGHIIIKPLGITVIHCKLEALFKRLGYQLSSIEERVQALVDTIQQLQHHKLVIKLLSHKQL
jgi:hypothetical protein